ncbi:MAG TPA: peptidoglycan DD-metalloendopeptidase family protein [Allosphingosinicella sp.]
MRRLILAPLLVLALAASGWAMAQSGGAAPSDLAQAKGEAEQARRRSELLERQAQKATGEASRARAEAAALAARIQAAEADITAAETRIRLVEQLRREQRARLAEKQAPLIRLTGALQTMARRPAALALVQPGSVDEIVHVRSLLASSLPVIRRRTAAVRAEIAEGNRLRKDAETAYAALTAGREDLRKRRVALARFEQSQRAKSETLMASAVNESDRALALGEEARDIAALVGTRAFQDQLRQRLSELPGPALRPGSQGATAQRAGPVYVLPVAGRLVTGMGEISDAGVHARGLTLVTAANAEVAAPSGGRVAYASAFRGYGEVVIIDHGGGWTSTLTNLGSLAVRRGEQVRPRQTVGRAGPREPRVGIELRRNGKPFPIAPLVVL